MELIEDRSFHIIFYEVHLIFHPMNRLKFMWNQLKEPVYDRDY